MTNNSLCPVMTLGLDTMCFYCRYVSGLFRGIGLPSIQVQVSNSLCPRPIYIGEHKELNNHHGTHEHQLVHVFSRSSSLGTARKLPKLVHVREIRPYGLNIHFRGKTTTVPGADATALANSLR